MEENSEYQTDGQQGLATNQSLTTNELTVLSALLTRASMASRLGQQFGGKRNLYDVLGYVKNPRFEDYYNKYDRQDIAGRIVDAPAAATWRNAPVVNEDDDESTETAFEAAWNDISKRLKVWHYLERADRLAGIGRYSVLLIGVRGSGDLSAPLEDGSLKGPGDIIYLSPFSEKSAKIQTWVTDPGDTRFGRPLMYKIDFAGDLKGSSFSAGQQLVHHSRVLHVADGLQEDEVYGRPRLKRVLNLLDDLAKVAGGSAEMFWQGAYRGLHADLRDGHDLGPGEAGKISDEIDEYIHGLRRYIRTQGMDLKALAGEVADPRGTFEVIMSLVAGATGIPKRILLGAERGELASSQDETNWNAHIHERQLHFAEPQVLRPFIDKLIALGAIPEPAEGPDSYKVNWPNLFELDEKEKAQVAASKADAIQKYAPFGETERVVPIPEFREKVLGLDPEPPEDMLPQPRDDDLGGDDDVDDEFRQRVRGRGRQAGGNTDSGD